MEWWTVNNIVLASATTINVDPIKYKHTNTEIVRPHGAFDMVGSSSNMKIRMIPRPMQKSHAKITKLPKNMLPLVDSYDFVSSFLDVAIPSAIPNARQEETTAVTRSRMLCVDGWTFADPIAPSAIGTPFLTES